MKLARNYNLNGWVRNRMRGDVEIVVEGERETIEEFIQDIKSGPNYGRVDAVDVEWKQATGQFHSFTIAR
jgi:acylphosphatase